MDFGLIELTLAIAGLGELQGRPGLLPAGWTTADRHAVEVSHLVGPLVRQVDDRGSIRAYRHLQDVTRRHQRTVELGQRATRQRDVYSSITSLAS